MPAEMNSWPVPFTVKGATMLMATWATRGLFKGAALVGAFVLIIALWLWDASLPTRRRTRISAW